MKQIDLNTLLEWTLKDFWKLLVSFILISGVAVWYALSVPNKYASKTVVMSNMSESSSLSGKLGQFGGLASLAGISLGGGEMSAEVLNEMLNSNSFLADFIRRHDLALTIMAAERYNPVNDTYTYKPDVYDQTNDTWVRDVDYPLTPEPSDGELVRKFKESFTTNYDRKTKLITLQFTFLSADFSRDILHKVVEDFNAYMRKNDIRNTEASLKELSTQLEQTQMSEIRTSLQSLIEEQMKKLTFAKTRHQYAVRVIEEPLLAVKKASPNRPLICIVIAVFGMGLVQLVLWTIRAIK